MATDYTERKQRQFDRGLARRNTDERLSADASDLLPSKCEHKIAYGDDKQRSNSKGKDGKSEKQIPYGDDKQEKQQQNNGHDAMTTPWPIVLSVFLRVKSWSIVDAIESVSSVLSIYS